MTQAMFYIRLGIQLVSIAVGIVWIMLLIIRTRGQKYSYYYAVLRCIVYKDKKPIQWLKSNGVYQVYWVQLFGTVALSLRRFEQIRTDEYLGFSIIGQVAMIVLSCSVIFMMNYIDPKNKQNGTA